MKNAEFDELNVELYNLMGQRMYQDMISNAQLQLGYEVPTTNLPDGQYFIRIFDRDRFATEKITVVHLR